MLAKLRSRLTYANAMATVAVFIALGGSSYAALRVTSRNVPKDALTGADIKNLTGKDVRNNSLTGADVRNLTSADVANGRLLGEDFASGQLPKGEKGDTGASGATGSPGATNVTVVQKTTSAGPNSQAFELAECPAGQRATGGGVAVNLFSSGDRVIQSGPVDADQSFTTMDTGEVPTGWAGRFFNANATSTREVYVWAVCAAP